MTAIIIPAYNPDIILNKLIEKTKKYVKKIIVIDDGSVTPIELSNKDVDVLRNDNNKGKGYSLIKGFQYALDNNIKQVITLDCDGQHDPEYIPEFLKCDKSIDIAVGKRNFTNDMPIHRKFSNTITSLILSVRCGKQILDSQCGFRFYNLEKINIDDYNETGFHFESEILIKVLSNGGTIAHIKIPTIYNNSISHIKNIKDTFKFIILIIRSFFW
jgi:hypothetical protein